MPARFTPNHPPSPTPIPLSASGECCCGSKTSAPTQRPASARRACCQRPTRLHTATRRTIHPVTATQADCWPPTRPPPPCPPPPQRTRVDAAAQEERTWRVHRSRARLLPERQVDRAQLLVEPFHLVLALARRDASHQRPDQRHHLGDTHNVHAKGRRAQLVALRGGQGPGRDGGASAGRGGRRAGGRARARSAAEAARRQTCWTTCRAMLGAAAASCWPLLLAWHPHAGASSPLMHTLTLKSARHVHAP